MLITVAVRSKAVPSSLSGSTLKFLIQIPLESLMYMHVQSLH